jgi:hypothetical protein
MANKTWIGAAGNLTSNWDADSHWNPGTAPGASDTFLINTPGTGAYTVTENAGVTVAPKFETTGDPELQVLAKRRKLQPLYCENGLHIFVLPKGATEVRLVSRAGAPTDVRPWLNDRRSLGVSVEQIVLRGASEVRAIPLDHPGLSQGWWAVERDGTAMRRWTDGDAELVLPA